MEAAAAVLIVVAAIVVRFWALQSQPGGLYPDEAAEGLGAQRLLTLPGYHPVFFDSDGGREALYAYIVAAVFKVFGSSVLTLRGAAAAVGVVGVIATYIAVRRFGRAPSGGATQPYFSNSSISMNCVDDASTTVSTRRASISLQHR